MGLLYTRYSHTIQYVECRRWSLELLHGAPIYQILPHNSVRRVQEELESRALTWSSHIPDTPTQFST